MDIIRLYIWISYDIIRFSVIRLRHVATSDSAAATLPGLSFSVHCTWRDTTDTCNRRRPSRLASSTSSTKTDGNDMNDSNYVLLFFWCRLPEWLGEFESVRCLHHPTLSPKWTDSLLSVRHAPHFLRSRLAGPQWQSTIISFLRGWIFHNISS